MPRKRPIKIERITPIKWKWWDIGSKDYSSDSLVIFVSRSLRLIFSSASCICFVRLSSTVNWTPHCPQYIGLDLTRSSRDRGMNKPHFGQRNPEGFTVSIVLYYYLFYLGFISIFVKISKEYMLPVYSAFKVNGKNPSSSNFSKKAGVSFLYKL